MKIRISCGLNIYMKYEKKERQCCVIKITNYKFFIKHERFPCIGVGILPESCYLLTFKKKNLFLQQKIILLQRYK